jgi:pre-mRNA-splicing factor SF3A2 (PRP11) subunit
VAPKQSNVQRKVFLKIGRPGYRVTKVRDRESGKEGMMVQIHLPQIKTGVVPRRRFMSAWEQRREPPNKSYQYLIVRANPYPFRMSSSDARSFFFFAAGWDRWQRSRTKPSHSAFQRARSKMSLTMEATGIGHTGTQTRSSIASSSCSETLSDFSIFVFSYLSQRLFTTRLIAKKSAVIVQLWWHYIKVTYIILRILHDASTY